MSDALRDLIEAETRERKRAEAAEARVEVAERTQEAAEAALEQERARVAELEEAIGAALACLPGQKHPHPDDSLQRLVNLARGMLDVPDLVSSKLQARVAELEDEVRRLTALTLEWQPSAMREAERQPWQEKGSRCGWTDTGICQSRIAKGCWWPECAKARKQDDG